MQQRTSGDSGEGRTAATAGVVDADVQMELDNLRDINERRLKEIESLHMEIAQLRSRCSELANVEVSIALTSTLLILSSS